MIEQQINRLKGKIVSFSYHVEKMIDMSIKGLVNKDKKILNAVIKEEETMANKFDNQIEKLCIASIAQFAPKALNLRTMLMILKMNKDLERMADHCVNICHNSKDIIKTKQPIDQYVKDISDMAQEVTGMLSDSINSFVEEDNSLAKGVCKRDEIVDNYKDNIINSFVKRMKEDADIIDNSLAFIEIAHNLERIADLSTNIAEDVVFVLKGKVIKH